MNINGIEKIITNKDFGDALKELITVKGWSYQKVADRAGVTKGYIGQIVNKTVQVPKDEYIKKIAKAMGVEPDYFKEYRVRKISDRLLFNKDDYDIPVSDNEAEYLAKVIDNHFNKKKLPNE